MDRKRAAIVLAAVVAIGCDKPTGKSDPPGGRASVPASAPDPPQPKVDTVADLVVKMDPLSCGEALAVAKRAMTDTINDDSPGAIVFALWAARRMRWADVDIAQDETTPALVKKDSDAERGKRICANAQIIQIKDEKQEHGGRLAVGIMQSDAGNLYRYFAAGSSGTLVENSYAHFCGFVTGTFDYANSGGGTGHAVSLVGMFDLPANKTPIARQTAR